MNLNDIFHLLKIEELECTHRNSCFSRYGMEGMFWYNGIKVHYGKYIILDISGSGCRTLETLYSNTFDWQAFIYLLIQAEGHISRLDVACDDLEDENNKPLLKFKTMFKHMEKNKYITKAQHIVYHKGSQEEIIIGSPRSDKLVRIYNKALERGYTDNKHWIRCEMQLRNECAIQFFNHWFLEGKDIGIVFGGTLLNLFRFVNKTYSGINSNRFNSTAWWSKFVNTTEIIKNVKIGGLEYNEYNVLNNITIQCASTIKTYLGLCEGNIDPLLKIIDNAKLNDKQRILLNNWDNRSIS